MSNCEKSIKEICDKHGFFSVCHAILTYVENRVEYCGEKIYAAEDKDIPSVISRLKEACAAYVARFCTNA
jgi:hypothetical protein